MTRAFVTGLSGTTLTEDERRFVAEAEPFGVILFRRNVEDPVQVLRLTDAVRDAAGRDLPVLVDQEGGRVQRLSAPHWRAYPSAGRIARAAAVSGDERLIEDTARLMAADLRAVGITVDCAPCLDLWMPGITEAIGDRSFGGDPRAVAASGRAVARGLLAGGVLPVMKHVPGHGRATLDSHLALPIVTASIEDLAATDFAPFVALADLPAAMTAHLVFTAIDPDWPATQSEVVIGEVIRGLIGFDGLLFSDDLSMQALTGPIGERARRCLAAGCDIALHCNGRLEEMAAVAAVAPRLEGPAAARAARALARIGAGEPCEAEAILARLETALASYDVALNI